jgi:HIRAN domain
MPTPTWILARLRGLQGANLEAGWWKKDDWRRWPAPYSIVRGESYRQDLLTTLAGKPRTHGYLIPLSARLVREPENPYDFNAIRVDVDRGQVGFIAKELAVNLAWLMDGVDCPSFRVAGLIRGGYKKKPYLGVMLWTGHRETAAPRIPVKSSWRATHWPPKRSTGHADW